MENDSGMTKYRVIEPRIQINDGHDEGMVLPESEKESALRELLLEAGRDKNHVKFSEICREVVSESQKEETVLVFALLLHEGNPDFLISLRNYDPVLFSSLIFRDTDRIMQSRIQLEKIYESAAEFEPDEGEEYGAEEAEDPSLLLRKRCADALGRAGAFVFSEDETKTAEAIRNAASLYQQISVPDRDLNALFNDASNLIFFMERFRSCWQNLISAEMKLLYSAGREDLRENDPSTSPAVLAKTIRWEQLLAKRKKTEDYSGWIEDIAAFLMSLSDENSDTQIPAVLLDSWRVRASAEFSSLGIYSGAVHFAELAEPGCRQRFEGRADIMNTMLLADCMNAIASCTTGTRAVDAYREAIELRQKLGSSYDSPVFVFDAARAHADLSLFYRTAGAEEDSSGEKEKEEREKALELMETILPEKASEYGSSPFRMATFALMLRLKRTEILCSRNAFQYRTALSEDYEFLWEGYRSVLSVREAREIHSVLSVVAYDAARSSEQDKRPEEAAKWCRRMLTEDARLKDKNNRELWRSIPHDLLAADCLDGSNEALALLVRAEKNINDLRGWAELEGRKEAWRDLRIRKSALKAKFCEEKWESANIPAWIANTESVVRELNEADDLSRDQHDMLYAVLRVRNAQILLYTKCGQFVRAQETMKVLENEFPSERAFSDYFEIPGDEEKRRILEQTASYMLSSVEKELNRDKMLRMAQIYDHLYADRIRDREGKSIVAGNLRFLPLQEFMRIARFFAVRDPEKKLPEILYRNILPAAEFLYRTGSITTTEDRELLAKIVFETEWEEIERMLPDGTFGPVSCRCYEEWILFSGNLQAAVGKPELTVRLALRRVALYALKGRYEEGLRLLPGTGEEIRPYGRDRRGDELKELVAEETSAAIRHMNNCLMLLCGTEWDKEAEDLEYTERDFDRHLEYYREEEKFLSCVLPYLCELARKTTEDGGKQEIPGLSFSLLAGSVALQRFRNGYRLVSDSISSGPQSEESGNLSEAEE